VVRQLRVGAGIVVKSGAADVAAELAVVRQLRVGGFDGLSQPRWCGGFVRGDAVWSAAGADDVVGSRVGAHSAGCGAVMAAAEVRGLRVGERSAILDGGGVGVFGGGGVGVRDRSARSGSPVGVAGWGVRWWRGMCSGSRCSPLGRSQSPGVFGGGGVCVRVRGVALLGRSQSPVVFSVGGVCVGVCGRDIAWRRGPRLG